MKTKWMVIFGVLGFASLGAYGQGVIVNANLWSQAGVDAPVTCASGLTQGLVTQLHAGPTEDLLQPIGSISSFGVGTGYWRAPARERTEGVVVPGVPPGQIACVRVAVWDASISDGSFEAALEAGMAAFSNFLYEATAGEPGSPTPIMFGTRGIPVCGVLLDFSEYPPVSANRISVAGDRSLFAFTTDGQRKSSYYVERSVNLHDWQPWIAVRGTMKLREAFSGEIDETGDAYFRVQGYEEVMPVFAQLWSGDVPTNYSYRLVGTRPRDFGAEDAPFYAPIEVVVQNGVVTSALGTRVVDGVEQPAIELDAPEDLSIPGMYALCDSADVSKGRRIVLRLGDDRTTPRSLSFHELPGYAIPLHTATLIDFRIAENP